MQGFEPQVLVDHKLARPVEQIAVLALQVYKNALPRRTQTRPNLRILNNRDALKSFYIFFWTETASHIRNAMLHDRMPRQMRQHVEIGFQHTLRGGQGRLWDKHEEELSIDKTYAEGSLRHSHNASVAKGVQYVYNMGHFGIGHLWADWQAEACGSHCLGQW